MLTTIAKLSSILLLRALNCVFRFATDASRETRSIIPIPGGPTNLVLAVSMVANGRPLTTRLYVSPRLADSCKEKQYLKNK